MNGRLRNSGINEVSLGKKLHESVSVRNCFMQQHLIQIQEEAVESILTTPQQGKRAAMYGMTLLNRQSREIGAIHKRYERKALKLGFSAEQVKLQWNDVKDMALLEARAEL